MKKPLLLWMIFTMVFLLLPIGYGHAQGTEPIVRVKLNNFLGNKTELTLKPTGNYITSDNNLTLKSNETYLLKQVNGKLSLYKDGKLVNSYKTFSVQPTEYSNQLLINNRAYLGSFDFVVENNLFVRPINSVYMEDYLKGVVPIEMYPSWNVEALKAQAVAARTYAMSYLNRGIINDTISYQVYGGFVWTPNTTKAVIETEGQVLQYNGRLIDAVYSASNGGMTEDNANAWGNTKVPYLNIKEDQYDPQTAWNFTLKKTQIDLTGKDLSKPATWWSSTKEADTTIANNIRLWLNNNGYVNKDLKIISISDFSLHDIGSGGRVNKGSITIEFLVKDKVDQTGKLIPQRVSLSNVSATNLRAIIGNRVMLSYLIDEVQSDSDTIYVKGRGDGHGVGMSQWGAKYMADAGKSHEEILKFYYSGIAIAKAYEVAEKSAIPSPMEKVFPVTGKRFPDVADTSWAKNEIYFLAEKGIINGYPNGNFGPKDSITRLQAVTMILREKGITDFQGTQDPGFIDMKPSTNGYDIIAKAVELSIINGKENQKGEKYFDPSGTLTRAEMAKILVTAYELEGTSTENFKDVKPDHWAYSFVQTLVKNGITNGIGDGFYGHADKLTREQFAVMMTRVINN